MMLSYSVCEKEALPKFCEILMQNEDGVFENCLYFIK